MRPEFCNPDHADLPALRAGQPPDSGFSSHPQKHRQLPPAQAYRALSRQSPGLPRDHRAVPFSVRRAAGQAVSAGSTGIIFFLIRPLLPSGAPAVPFS